MDRKYKVEYLPIAVKDLTEIIEYIQLDSPQNALSFLDRIDSTIIKLEDFPSLGPAPKDIRLQRLGYRMLIIDNYLVFYVIKDEVIEIRRIVYGGRKYNFLL